MLLTWGRSEPTSAAEAPAPLPCNLTAPKLPCVRAWAVGLGVAASLLSGVGAWGTARGGSGPAWRAAAPSSPHPVLLLGLCWASSHVSALSMVFGMAVLV